MNLKKFPLALIGLEQDIINELEMNNHNIIGYFGNKKKQKKYKYLGSFKDIKNFVFKNSEVKIIIAMGPLDIRKNLLKKFKKKVYTYISPKSLVSKNANIGLGTFIQSYCYVGNNTRIGNCCKINVRCNIHHDTYIGSFTDLAPNAVLLGNSKVGKDCYIGSGSTIREKVKIGNNILTGINSAIVKDLRLPGTYIGIPAKRFRKSYNRP